MATLSRKRWDHNPTKDAVLPALYSLQLFELQIKATSSLCEYQLSVRWSSLARVYSSLELWDEAILAATLALLFDTLESSVSSRVTDCDHRIDFLRILASSTKGALYFGPFDLPSQLQRRKKSVGKLLRLIQQSNSEHLFDENAVPPKFALAPSHAVSSLLEANDGKTLVSIFEARCCINFGFVNVFRVVLTKHAASSFKEVDPGLFASELASTFIEIVAGAGQRLQGGDPKFSRSGYAQISRLAASSACSVGPDDDSGFRAVARALVSVVQSAALLPSKAFLDAGSHISAPAPRTEMIPWSYESISEAACVLSGAKAESTSPMSLLLRSILVATQFARSVHPHVSHCESDIVVQARDLVEHLSIKRRGSEMVIAAKNCALWVLARLSDVLSYEGNALEAAQTAFWSQWVAPIDQSEATKSWLSATSFLRVQTESVLAVAPFVSRPDRLDVVDKSAVGLEGRSTCLSAALLESASEQSQKDVERSLHELLEDIDHHLSESDGMRSCGVFLLWTKSSVLLSLATCVERQGELQRNVAFLGECYAICSKLKLLLASLFSSGSDAQNVSNDNFLSEIAFASLYPRAVVRQIECSHHLATTHSRLGDYRTALGYTESLLRDFGSTFVVAGITGKTELADLLGLFKADQSTCLRVIQLRRIHLTFRMKAATLDELHEQFHGTRFEYVDALSARHQQGIAKASLNAEEVFGLLLSKSS